jgi:uncharacterized protein
MTTTKTPLRTINDFLGLKRLAVAGVSRDLQDFSYLLFKELEGRGYDVVPVNPNATEIGGDTCYARVQDIFPPVEGVLIMTPPNVTEQVVLDCAQAGIKHVWLHRGAGFGAVSPKAVELCEQNDIAVVKGYCPYMFLPNTQIFHKLHGFGLKMVGRYPN